MGTCTRGNIVMVGSAYYYDGWSEWPPAGFQVEGRPPTGQLPVARQAPHLPASDSGLKRTLISSWDCCVGTSGQYFGFDSVLTYRDEQL